MLFRIRLRAESGKWSVSIDAPDAQGWAADPRQLSPGAKGYPHPEPGEAPCWESDIAELCTDAADTLTEALHQRIVAGDPDAGDRDVERFGGYLRAVMFGPWWERIRNVVPNGPLAIELDIPAKDAKLQRLPWEMMAENGVPLAAIPDKNRRVAITRIIETDLPPPVRPIAMPLRVLFVVGQQMDGALRPGAEYLGLLRQFRTAKKPGEAEAVGAGLHTRLLSQATAEILADAIDAFSPSVVHFVAHGRVGNDGPEILLTGQDGSNEPDPVGPARLAQLLRGKKGDTSPVQAVLLNACHSADTDSSYLPFVAGLITRGVPVAVGMSGEVADGACRIFTRAFYRGLIEARDIAVACADGRRSAMLFYRQTYSTSVDWARPTLFRAAAANPVFTTDAALAARARAAILFRRRGETQLLCDRMGALQAFQSLCATARTGGKVGLAFEVTVPESGILPQADGRVLQFGKTWLLNEFASQAALEGFVPCVVESAQSAEVPANLLLFAIRLAEAMDETREKYGSGMRVRSTSADLAFHILKRNVAFDAANPTDYVWALDDAKATLRSPADNGGDWGSQAAVESAIQQDIKRLLLDLVPDGSGAALILIDDLHRYEGAEISLLKAIRMYGLGTQQTPAPVVFTYSTREKAGPRILHELKAREGEIRREQLTTFTRPFEAILAYRQYFLSRNYALTSSREHREQVAEVLKVIDETEILGVPSYLVNLDRALMWLAATKVLVPANDEAIVAAQGEKDGIL